LRAVLT